MRDRERERQRHRQREKQAPCREPDGGLDPRSPGSHPGLKAVLNHLGCPETFKNYESLCPISRSLDIFVLGCGLHGTPGESKVRNH